MTTSPRKTKRILTNIDFSGDKAHIALTSKENGPANGADYALVLKSSNFSPEYITKIQAIQVTLELPEFLERFFGLYYTDSKILAGVLGYVEPADETMPSDSYSSYIQDQIDSYTVLKALNDAEDRTNILSTLDQEQYLGLIKDQALLEKALGQVAEKKSDELAKATHADTSLTPSKVKDEVTASEVKLIKSEVVTPTKKGKQMLKPVDGNSPEMVEKSQLTALEKAVQAGQEALTKAMATIAEFEVKQKEQVIKSKTARFAAVIKDEKILAPIVKASLELDSDEDFDAFLAAITSMAASIEVSASFIEKSALFVEQGASASEEQPFKESAVARILKAQNQSSKS